MKCFTMIHIDLQVLLSTSGVSDGDCSHEIKRHLLLGRTAMTNLDSTLKGRDITITTLTESAQSKLWFFQWSCRNVRIGP